MKASTSVGRSINRQIDIDLSQVEAHRIPSYLVNVYIQHQVMQRLGKYTEACSKNDSNRGQRQPVTSGMAGFDSDDI